MSVNIQNPQIHISKQVSLFKSCSHKARLVTYEIPNKNTINTNTIYAAVAVVDAPSISHIVSVDEMSGTREGDATGLSNVSLSEVN